MNCRPLGKFGSYIVSDELKIFVRTLLSICDMTEAAAMTVLQKYPAIEARISSQSFIYCWDCGMRVFVIATLLGTIYASAGAAQLGRT